ncbi:MULTISPECIES: manganese efflux pump MntP family protein [Idiomarina]|uniref:Putative manganese efflux pump MntP n=2 Tax=Idiomarina baltica TaxID=190892 RepID=A0A348WPW7_9GAMM|nr:MULTISPECIES: manganese efflux pump MntP family protein [Idiomarina]MAF74586.1 hypothetical protein [Idiomarinaceae bacterium]MEC8924525.1 manganese efflux pump MntP family protein [Pseudomonadota bacterium]HAE90230.1 hypothetical protein [Idiomarina sp.]HAR56579.1 hypothetical protein [Idiomarina baltica]
MSILSMFLIGLAMSTDAFAAAIGKGIAMRKPTVKQALKIGILFGVVEAITPMLGWLLGKAAAQIISEYDHWVALVLLSLLGLHMIKEGLSSDDDQDSEVDPTQQPFIKLFLTSIATSIDAMAVGVGMAFLDVNILLVAVIIGCSTFAAVTVGVIIGRYAGHVIGRYAEVVGGVVLIGVGVGIAAEHVGLLQ